MLACTIYIYIDCMGSYSASGNDPDWSVQWTVRGDMIDFVVSAQTTGWVGIGFSGDRQMVVTFIDVFTILTLPRIYTSMPIRIYDN